MKRFKQLFKVLFILLIFSNLAYALKESEITSQMKIKLDEAVKILSNKELSNEIKNKELFKIFDDIFDYELMSKLSLGNQWNLLNSDQKEIFVKNFELRIKNSYVSKLDLYTDQKVAIKDQRKIKDKRIEVSMEIYAQKDTYEIVYKFYKNEKNDWLIYDVDILGISIIKTYRSQFDGILKKGNFQELIDKLNQVKVKN